MDHLSEQETELKEMKLKEFYILCPHPCLCHQREEVKGQISKSELKHH